MMFNPDTLSPPCDTIQDFLDESGRGWIDEIEDLDRLLKNRKRITEPIAETLSQYLGSTPQFWLNRQRNYEQAAANCGDLLKIEKGIIGHQVNCRGVMNAGLARQIATRYPLAKRHYHYYLKDLGSQALGTFSLAEVAPGLSVANLFGQRGYGTDRCHTSYNALNEIAIKLKGLGYLIHLPAQMGCGLGGGDWGTVREIFARVDVIWVTGK